MSWQRLAKLISIDWQSQRGGISKGAIACFIILFVTSFTGGHGLYFVLLYSIGFYLSAMAFEDVHQPTLGYQYMTLPSSQLEKFLARILQTTLILSVGLLLINVAAKMLFHITLYLIIFFAEPKAQHFHLLFNYNIFDMRLFMGLLNYFTLTTIIFVGSVYFKRYTLLKTGLGFALVVTCYVSSLALLSWIACAYCDLFTQEQYFKLLLNTGNTWFWHIVAPLSLYVSYRKFTRTELRA